eukprot:TRINITY_DN54082_c0_g1_i1.p1 TRINITY_DN54082_c0_g1~~TRINITY_DN54082_c0_g1_i1.p1  ORF type:complete len:430 (+),score=118.38 TRINITY_DN54082_c0_g1_i1:146-1435(+)
MDLAFVAGPSAPVRLTPLVASPVSLRGAAASAVLPEAALPGGQAASSGPFAFAAASVAGFLAAVAARATATSTSSSQRRVACRAKAAPKKKGVRVVDGREIPWNLFGPKAPYKAKVVENRSQPHTLTTPHSDAPGDANWETVHITLEHNGKVPYVEGQSIGLIPPGPDKKGETPARLRLYSIASSAVGDHEDSQTVSLCVKRLVEVEHEKKQLKHWNRDVGEDKPDKAGTHFPENRVYRGVSSNYVCDLKVGDEVLITGPTGAEMLLPEEDDCNIIMLATGTGIAPMRSYLRLLFNDEAGANADGSRRFQGKAWLFLGVPHSTSILYDDEHQEYKSKYPDQFRYDYAISREATNAAGERMYIQTKMAEYAEELWDLMQDPKTHIYMCGLKGMEQGCEECFGPLAEKHGVNWKDFAKSMKKQKRYHVEVY